MKCFVFLIMLAYAQHTIQVSIASKLTKKQLNVNTETRSNPASPGFSAHREHHNLSSDYPVSATTSWAGATIDMLRGNTSEVNVPAIGSVKAQWSIPRLCLREGQNISSAGTLQTWIGISGKACDPKGAMIQAGVRAVLQDDGTTAASAWASWYPAIPYMDIVDFNVRAGDVVTVVLTVSNATSGEVQITNKRTSHVATQPVYSPDPSVGDFSICGDGDGRAWAVVEGPFAGEKDPPDTATSAAEIPVFDDVSFRTLEVSAPGKAGARGLHDDTAMLYIVADSQGVAVNVDALGDNGFQLYTTQSCANDLENYV
ncbi:concanavalin A-like lectin/glucanase domain-containing protein [Hypoxylon argillaceum]|nr:concanavalin A-like lectin/glucanase domain-containing protein [Hypoxylon argillaceum]